MNFTQKMDRLFEVAGKRREFWIKEDKKVGSTDHEWKVFGPGVWLENKEVVKKFTHVREVDPELDILIQDLISRTRGLVGALEWYSRQFGHNEDGLSVSKKAYEALEKFNK